MKIEYIGHACFKITKQDGYSVVLDPYCAKTVPGLTDSPLTANGVHCSHEHEDHCGIEQVTIRAYAEDVEPFQVHTIEVPHDDQEGKLRGMNEITILEGDGIWIAHLGDLGRMLTEEECKLLKGFDVVMCPVGGVYTIDAEVAKKVLDRIQPTCAILMHYRTEKSGYECLADLNEVAKTFPELQQLTTSEIEVGSVHGVVTLKAANEN